jgi:hypothetical protein
MELINYHYVYITTNFVLEGPNYWFSIHLLWWFNLEFCELLNLLSGK